MGVLGRTVSVPSIVAPRIVFAEMAGIFAVMAVLSYKFVNSKPNWLDSVCLVGAVTASVYSLLGNRPMTYLLVAGLLLGVGSAYHAFEAREGLRSSS